ncbi:MAG: isocitrate lyase/phosphoenolpyruvate mutase family protein [Gammaproteobacteria bacterium]|nr:isocitrate lyase/phosphoenolpyruvate mutase family protein [Gammaproteobacteria bacterium]MDE2109206.1 isocitrate lyase/phosphoenolpyruvate mutase family protein [Gammaproteobacteria bacterium]MDE2460829.1 isocitrate lyase/phosphoenolpyruvate mutase family protein [Gammaproteobacteria bacterium]
MSDLASQKRKAELLKSLHQAPPILVLPNAWDAASAALFAQAGARAIATTSAGVANALGFADGQFTPLAEVLTATRRIAEAVPVPVSADLEAGYADTPAALQSVIKQLLATGAVGVNLEDGLPPGSPQPLRDVADQQARLRAARAAADAAGIPLVINARTDVFLHQVGAPESRLGETLRRLKAYAQAGADCLFAPGVADAATIAALLRELKLPLNVLAGPATPAVSELQKLGVARVSVGSGLHRASLAFAERATREILAGGGFKALASDLTYGKLNELMKSRSA